MRTTSEKTAKQKMILAKAVLAAAERLGLAQDQLALTLNIDSVKTLTSLELDPTSKQGEIALTLIRYYHITRCSYRWGYSLDAAFYEITQ